MDDDTIAALATPSGRGGIAVIRISGAKTRKIIAKILEKLPAAIAPQKAYHTFVVADKKRLDECIVVFFKAPHSYTGEDLAEISIHSNPFLIEAVLSLIYRNQARQAMPGEFTYRAFKNGKMDLIQAEAVHELISAGSQYYTLMKFGSLEGKLSAMLNRIKESLRQLGIKIETRIEFEEDQGFEEINLTAELEEAMTNLQTVLENSRFNDMLNKGLNVVIVGKVNVGKSSLFNSLLLEERSIISAIPGTTRDFIREKLFIDGFPIEITDMAGVHRETKDEIESQGIKRSLEQIQAGDAVIFMLDVSRDLDKTDDEIFALVKDKKKIIVANKMDVAKPHVIGEIESRFKGETIAAVSVKENRNIDKIRDFLKTLVMGITEQDIEVTVNQRQKACLEKLMIVLAQVKRMTAAGSSNAEIIAEEIREGMRIIGELMGEITTDDILHGIFSQFCVGK